jgi:HEAT repeat protein
LLSLAAPPNPSPDNRLLASAHLTSDPASLLDFVQKRSQGKVDAAHIRRLVERLSGTDEKDARRAMGELVRLGPAALPILREAQKTAREGKPRMRLQECLRWLEGPDADELSRAVVRRLAKLRPEGTVSALFAYLLAADNDSVAEEVREALVALAIRNGKVDPLLEQAALREASSARRLAAVEILCQADASDVVRKLLRDPSREIRARTAITRLEQGDGEAVPVLIDLLQESARPEARQALDALKRLAGPRAPGSQEPKDWHADWARWWRSLNDATLLKYLRDRTPDVGPERIPELVAQLGSKSFRVREKAEQDLITLRGLSVPLLERALQHRDIEVRRRAERCLSAIRSEAGAGDAAANVRLLTVRRPAGVMQTLIAYVAFATSETVEDEVRQALRNLARRDSVAVRLLLAALEDRVPRRRSVAAAVLAEVATAEQLPALRKLLADPEPVVRFAAALGLAQRQERQAVPVLIELLEGLPADRAWLVEDALRRLAGEIGPATQFEPEPAARKKYRQLWAEWWKAHQDDVNLTRLRRSEALLGYTLLSLWDGSNVNSIVEMGRDRQQRWKVTNLGYSFDFVVLPGNRLLCAEHNQNRVTERNFRGEILWEHPISSPINCQRLPNGLTFITACTYMEIVDRQHNVVLKVDRHTNLMGGQRFRDGRILLVDGGGRCYVLDPTGKLLREFNVKGGLSNFGGVQELPGSHFLLAQHDHNLVSEYDLEGKLIWSAEAPSPNFATRLPNGHTLVGSQDSRCMVELDRNGKQVSEYKPGQSVWRVRRR